MCVGVYVCVCVFVCNLGVCVGGCIWVCVCGCVGVIWVCVWVFMCMCVCVGVCECERKRFCKKMEWPGSRKWKYVNESCYLRKVEKRKQANMQTRTLKTAT